MCFYFGADILSVFHFRLIRSICCSLTWKKLVTILRVKVKIKLRWVCLFSVLQEFWQKFKLRPVAAREKVSLSITFS